MSFLRSFLCVLWGLCVRHGFFFTPVCHAAGASLETKEIAEMFSLPKANRYARIRAETNSEYS
jgi:hypothetical protein